ncbi:sulfotransferase domain-containing protein [Desulfonatronum thioautotrophicum]|uniref:sulfotransferase domain-containing protein n=1 Tax=Desulfonatronum thioautotrophicum TaxID=617001 RepID=UPI00129482C4|nr:sulfotransferase domain-containing protein [Desulfonatronum thioautotrophicum]
MVVNYTKEYINVSGFASERLITSGKPVIVVTMPRSGTAYIRNVISTHLNLKLVYKYQYASGPRLKYFINHNTLFNEITRKRVYVAGHFPPSHYNLQLLKLSGVKKIVVHFRDPRDALLSWNNHICKPKIIKSELSQIQLLASRNSIACNHYKLSPHEQIDWLIDNYFCDLIEWMYDWLVAKSKNEYIDILLTDFDMLKNTPLAFFNKIINFFNYDKFISNASQLPNPRINPLKYNFNLGQSGNYLQEFNDQQILKTHDILCEKFQSKPYLLQKYGWLKKNSN